MSGPETHSLGASDSARVGLRRGPLSKQSVLRAVDWAHMGDPDAYLSRLMSGVLYTLSPTVDPFTPGVLTLVRPTVSHPLRSRHSPGVSEGLPPLCVKQLIKISTVVTSTLLV